VSEPTPERVAEAVTRLRWHLDQPLMGEANVLISALAAAKRSRKASLKAAEKVAKDTAATYDDARFARIVALNVVEMLADAGLLAQANPEEES
jgi:hypothetical protein